jgi:hypothetical protein
MTLGVLAAFALNGCNSSRTTDLDSALGATRRGEYSLAVVTDWFVPFQGGHHKDQYYFAGSLPQADLTRIKAAVAAGSSPSQPVHFEDIRTDSLPNGH